MNRAVPVVAASFVALVVGGLIIIFNLIIISQSLGMQVALALLSLSLVGMILRIGLIGLRTRQAQQKIAD